MRVPLIPVLLALVAGMVADAYLYRLMRRRGTPRLWCWVYVAIAAIVTTGMAAVAFVPKKSTDDAGLLVLIWALYIYMCVYLPKYVFAAFALVRSLLRRIYHRSLRGIAIAGAVVSASLCMVMIWGAFWGRYRLQTREVTVTVETLPRAFDGYRIVQLSDIHTGTFGGYTTFLSKVVNQVNSLHPDIILFTGDIVNRHSAELAPFTAVLGTLHAPDGVWSVMGNHDYGDYMAWPSVQAKQADIARLQQLQRGMGWHMLNDSTAYMVRGGDTLAVAGVENIGEPPFHTYGSLNRALRGVSPSMTKILLSHNPMHWVDSIAGHAGRDIALTLSGHTHAMQMSVGGWSPAAWRYPCWSGLYTDSLGRALYVNIGTGEVGFPARVGAAPEITLITLRSKQ